MTPTRLELSSLLGRRLRIWEQDLYYIMWLTSSINWLGASDESPSYFEQSNINELYKGYAKTRTEAQWQRVGSDQLVTIPGIYKYDLEGQHRCFAVFIGNRVYTFEFTAEEERYNVPRILLQGVSSGSLLRNIERNLEIPLTDLHRKLLREVELGL